MSRPDSHGELDARASFPDLHYDARLHEALGDLPPAGFETLSQSSYGPTNPLMTKAGTN